MCVEGEGVVERGRKRNEGAREGERKEGKEGGRERDGGKGRTEGGGGVRKEGGRVMEGRVGGRGRGRRRKEGAGDECVTHPSLSDNSSCSDILCQHGPSGTVWVEDAV